MPQIAEHRFDSRQELLAELLATVTGTLAGAVREQGKASMLLSGGTTPGVLYERMSQADLAWENIWFGLTDERWVAPDHADSNERLVNETLVQNKASTTNLVGLKSDFPTPAEGCAATEQQNAVLPKPYDIVLLGMGTDGHTASLFPTSKDTPAALDPENSCACHPIRRGDEDVQRITMTLSNLLQSKQIFLFMYGAEKAAVFAEALKEKTDVLPVSHILHQDTVPVTLYWAE